MQAPTQALVTALRDESLRQNQHSASQVQGMAAAILVLLTLLGLGVAEPVARALLRQQNRLAAQTRELHRLALVAEHTNSAVLITDAHGRVEWVNAAHARITGHPAGAVLGQLAWLAGGPDNAEAHQPLRRAMAEGQPLRMELRQHSRHGREYWLDTDLQPLLDADGRLIGHLLVETEVTEQVMQRQKLSLTVEGAGLGTWDWDLRTNRVSGNAQWWAMLGREPSTGATDLADWRGIVHPDDLGPTMTAFREHLEGGNNSINVEYRLRHANGSWCWVMSAGTVIERNSQGAPLRVSGVHVDISRERNARIDSAAARDAATAALAELDAYRVALDQHAIVAVTDPAGVITRVNDVFCRISKYSREELVGHNHGRVSSGEHPAAFWAQMWQTINAGRVWRGEVCNLAKDGSRYWVDTTIVPRMDEQGRITEHLAIRIDVTHRKRLESELRHRALTDTLTQLPNRTVVIDRLQLAIARARRMPVLPLCAAVHGLRPLQGGQRQPGPQHRRRPAAPDRAAPAADPARQRLGGPQRRQRGRRRGHQPHGGPHRR